ncbi:hypothetical protein GCM10025867_17120 [Frondihabitans sucicola]|uniref:ASCH domain-containing protein n=1 Tax=Frondihabitans sucicola TaxID=1268041 RepID=A0ABM8GM38_9MICO|nr:ASCH domain-containing protein [Frondihabitans sucicola]BDZ49471.1 hypothetical protein GCM10025867_17120 [Frondihabitans sucicola]
MFPRSGHERVMEFGTPGPLRQQLVGLVVAGAKTATAGRLAEYADEGEELEHLGEVLVVVDDAGSPVASIRITRVDVVPFADVPWEFADAEGEGFVDLADWRAQHRAFWSRASGAPVSDDELIVCLRFELLAAAP